MLNNFVPEHIWALSFPPNQTHNRTSTICSFISSLPKLPAYQKRTHAKGFLHKRGGSSADSTPHEPYHTAVSPQHKRSILYLVDGQHRSTATHTHAETPHFFCFSLVSLQQNRVYVHSFWGRNKPGRQKWTGTRSEQTNKRTNERHGQNLLTLAHEAVASHCTVSTALPTLNTSIYSSLQGYMRWTGSQGHCTGNKNFVTTSQGRRRATQLVCGRYVHT